MNKRAKLNLFVILPVALLSLAGAPATESSAEPAPATQAHAPQRVSFGFTTTYEISSQGCQRAAALVCTIMVHQVGSGRDNGLILFVQSSSGTSTVAVGGKRYPVTGIRLANSRQPFVRDKYWRTFANDEESTIELEFGDAGPVPVTQLAVVVSALGGSTSRVIKFESVGTE